MFLAPELYSNDCSLPIFAKGKSEATKTSIAVRTLLKGHDSSRICSDVPLYVDKNVEFIVDTNRLLHWKDLHSDLSGFVRTKTKKFYYDSKSQDLDINRSKNHDLTVTRYIYVHSDHKDFHKVVVSVSPKNDKQPMNLVYLQYYFDDEEQKVNFNRIHGNTKGEKSWRQTKFSVKEKIKSLTREGVKRNRIFQEISKSAAGFEGGQSGADFPVSMLRFVISLEKTIKK